ncbi:MAG: YkgJ family cysteine cluster protein [Desulfovibrio sp.]|jgi:Fe-S-cluster containining protein|nr:YkgJ family cysteine cluster protein [Desulfovibrio sp.]
MEDATQTFLKSLPQLAPGESFWFACHPDVPCFNACCADLTMPLTPYDVLRLCCGLNMGSEQFFEEFSRVGCYEDTGFPLLHLRMEDTPGRPCPFVTEHGCGVYAHRSSACRTYPLGRAACRAERVEEAAESGGCGTCGRVPNGTTAGSHPVILEERYFLVREEHCQGFAESGKWTVESWLEDQGMEHYNHMNDRYMRLLARYKERAGGARLSGKHATMALLCLYQQDRFLEFLQSMRIFSRILITGDYGGVTGTEAVDLILRNAEQRLRFAFDWVELLLVGASDNLTPVGMPAG